MAEAPHEAQVAVVRALYDAFARRDLEGALALMDPQIAFSPARTSEATGREEPYRGHDGIRAYFAEVGRVWSDLTLEADDFRAAGDAVIVFGRARGRSEEQAFDDQVTWVWKVRAGRAVSGRSFSSPAAAERAAQPGAER